MVDVPIVKKDGNVRGISPARLSPVSQSNDVVNYAGAMDKLTGVYSEFEKTKSENLEKMKMLEAQKFFDKFDEDRLFSPQNGALNKVGKDTIDISKSVLGDFDKQAQKYRETFKDDADKVRFDDMAISRRATVMKQIMAHEANHVQKFEIDFANGVSDSGKNRAALFYNNPETRESSIANAKSALEAFAQGKPAMKEKLSGDLSKIESEARLAVLARFADNDPAGAVEFYNQYKDKFTDMDAVKAAKMLEPAVKKHQAQSVANKVLSSAKPRIEKSEIINYVMYNLEGGDKVVKDGDGTTKFGINSQANGMTDEEVANLTPEGAANIKKEKYWDKNNIDELPAQMRLVVYDGYVHGFDPKVMGKTLKQVAEEADGDPLKVVAVRREYYEKLYKANPKKYAPVITGWMNRLDDVERQIFAASGRLPDENKLISDIDRDVANPDVAAEAKKIVSSEIGARRAAQEKQYADANEMAHSYVREGKEVPPSVVAQMSSDDVAKMKDSKLDPALYQELKTKIASGQDVDLNKYRWQLGSKYEELVGMKGDPKKIANAKTIQDVRDRNIRKLIGKSKPSGKDWERIDAFDTAIDREIMAFQSINGKPATPDDVQRIADRMLLEVDVNKNWWFDKKSRYFEVKPDDEGVMPKMDIRGINRDGSHYVGTKQVSYETLIATLIGLAEDRGIEVSAEELEKLYKDQIKKGKISWKDN